VIPAFHRRGSGGPTLVCHTGGPGFSARSFGDVAGLDAELDLVLVDPRGTGDTPRPDDAGAYRVDDYVGDIEELRAHLGLQQMNLLGWSHGGVVAMKYAAVYPAKLGKLILYSTLPRFQADQEQAMREAMEKRSGEPWYGDAVAALEAEQAGEFATEEELGALWTREAPLYFARFGERERTYLDSVAEPVNADALRLFNTHIFAAFDLRPDLARIEAPTLVIVGEEDFLAGPACAREIAEGIRGARVVRVPGAGHFVHVEARDRFREEVLRFLAS
jgi:pimeloyl-ACP methyl ester carboxylesterase